MVDKKTPIVPPKMAAKAVPKAYKGSDRVKAKNIGRGTLALLNGRIKAGDIGTATRAECSTLFKHLEIV